MAEMNCDRAAELLLELLPADTFGSVPAFPCRSAESHRRYSRGFTHLR